MKLLFYKISIFILCILLAGCSLQKSDNDGLQTATIAPDIAQILRPIQTLKPVKQREFVDNFVVCKVDRDGQSIEYGIMDMKGNLIVDTVYAQATRFNSYGLAKVVSYTDGVYRAGIIDMKGNFIVPLQDSNCILLEGKEIIQYFADAGSDSTGKRIWNTGYLDYNGNILLSAKYEDAIYMDENHIFVKEDGMWKIIDLAENTHKVLEGVTYIQNEGEGFVAFTTSQRDEAFPWLEVKGNWGYMYMDGEIVLPEQYQKAYPFSEGRAFVRVKDIEAYGGGNLYIIDNKGNVITTYEGGSLTEGEDFRNELDVIAFRGGVAIVDPGYDSYGYGAVDIDGRWVIDPKYVLHNDNGIITAYESLGSGKERLRFFNTKGQMIFEKKYPCTRFKNGFAFYIENDRIYVMNAHGKTVLKIPEGYVPEDAYTMWSSWHREQKNTAQ